METRALAGPPAGPRKDAADPEGRPELISRQDWAVWPELQTYTEAGIDFCLQVQAPERLPADFDPNTIEVPFGLHADNYGLTKLWQAEQEGDLTTVEHFWAMAGRWAGWRSALGPERFRYANFHGADLGGIPPMDEKRLNCLIDPDEWLKRAKWHESVFARLIELGVPATLEWVYVTTYYGPPYFPPNWLPLLCFQPRIGIWRDVRNICEAVPGLRPLVDFEHLESCRESLSGESLEIKSLASPQFATTGQNPDFEAYFGFAAEQNRICRFTEPQTWEQLVQETSPSVCHIGGIQGQLVALSFYDSDTPYHRAIFDQVADPRYADVVPDPTYVQNLIRFRRGGSHAAVSTSDQRLRQMLSCVLSYEHDLPPIFIAETADFGEGKKEGEDPGYWYWAKPDAMKLSVQETFALLAELAPV